MADHAVPPAPGGTRVPDTSAAEPSAGRTGGAMTEPGQASRPHGATSAAALLRGGWASVIPAALRASLRPSGTPTRTQWLSLHRGRVTVLGVAVVVAAVVLGTLDTWNALLTRSELEAFEAREFVDARIDAVDAEIERLSLSMPPVARRATCTPDRAIALTAASLRSELVSRFLLIDESATIACRPTGTDDQRRVPYAPQSMLTRTPDGEVVRYGPGTWRMDGSGTRLIAILDPRAFEPRSHEPHAWHLSTNSRVALVSAENQQLAGLGMRAPRTPVVAALRSTVSGRRRDAIVVADIARSTLLNGIGSSILTMLGVLGVLSLGLVVVERHRALRRVSPYHRIRAAVRKRQFEPWVQPIVDLTTGRCAGVEVLMRWHHPQRGVISPAEFIDEAERTGLILDMADLVMMRAAHRLAQIANEFPDLYFAFNLTAAQLAHRHLPARLDELFRDATIPRERVLLELTEREFVDATTVAVLNSLRADGWRVAIDDFGTGHSSLSALEQLRIDRLKIDRAFVSTISEETLSRPVLDAIIDLATRLDVVMIAEGVETRKQWEYLATRGVQYAQGYLIARPMEISTFADWIKVQNAGTPQSRRAIDRTSLREHGGADFKAQQIWNEMRTPGGLDIRDRMFRLRSYPECFVGREAVDWLVERLQINRTHAVAIGRRLTALGLIHHVVDEHDFEDAELFYRLATPTAVQQTARTISSDLRTQMRGKAGVRWQPAVRGLIRHDHCATGSAIVSWICRESRVPRSTATQWAAQLMREGDLRHVYDDRPFRDNASLYRPA